MTSRQWPVVTVLGITQTLSWASSYYIPAVLADTIAKDLSISTVWIFGAFSLSLLISALLGPRIGRQIDAFGGNGVLAASNVMIAGGLILLGLAHGVPLLCAAWLVLGFGMGFGLYDSAFAALGRIYGANARSAITGITLIAGFASTVGWPLTAWGAAEIGWRNTCFAWAVANVLLGLPMNLFLLPRPAGTTGAAAAQAMQIKPQRAVRPADVPDRFCLCVGLDRDRRHGGAFSASAGSLWCDGRASDCRRRPDRSGAGRRPYARSGFPEPVSPARFGASGHYHASDRRGRSSDGGRRCRVERLCSAAWVRQWRSDDRARNGAAVDLRAGELRLSARPDRRAGAHFPGVRPARHSGC